MTEDPTPQVQLVRRRWRWRRILLSLAAMAGLVILYAWVLGPQTMMVYLAHDLFKGEPWMNATYTELDDVAPSRAPGMTLSYSGFTFEVPWTDLDAEHTLTCVDNTHAPEKEGTRSDTCVRAVVHFRSGLEIGVLAMKPHAVVGEFRSSIGKDGLAALGPWGGKEPSDYDLTRLILEATPKSVSIFQPREVLVRTQLRLMLKAISTPLAGSPVFSIHTDRWRGFQHGRPASKPREIVSDLFGGDGGVELVFERLDKKPLEIAQADINRVVQTIKPAPRRQTTH